MPYILFVILFNGTSTNSPISTQAIPQSSLELCRANASFMKSEVPNGIYSKFICIQTEPTK